jgi:hypothetical protein
MGSLRNCLPANGENELGSSVNMRSGLLAVGALRPEEGSSQEPVALETAVIATGARPGDTAAKRELFTEETVTVLVFEHGAVIRLSAAVADGQLLFLSNKNTGKEVVTQVIRKRAFRPTNCYVDLEFTEPCPGFWGIEFPKPGAVANGPAPAPAKDLADEADRIAEQAKAASPPSVQEIDGLKNEVAELQTQLKTLLQTGQGGKAGAKAASEISAELAKKEVEQRFAELLAVEAKQDESQLPEQLVAYPEKSAKKTLVTSSRSKVMVLASTVVVLAAVGAYQTGVFHTFTNEPFGPKAAPSRPAPVASAPTAGKPVLGNAAQGTVIDNSRPATSAQPSAEKDLATGPFHSDLAANKAEMDGAAESAAAKVSALPSKTDGVAGSESARASKAVRGNSSPGAASDQSNPPAGGSDSSAASPNLTSSNTGIASSSDEYVAPKLLKAVRPVAPAEALRNYVTGNVNADLLVDLAGHVKSVTIVSGPEKLRPAAKDFAKQYVYEPAKRNGKAVSAHVQVRLQFWYEP